MIHSLEKALRICACKNRTTLGIGLLIIRLGLNSLALGGDVRFPRIDAEHAFGTTYNNFIGTTSVGLRAGSLLIYYEYGGKDLEEPAPGWIQVDFFNFAADKIEFTLDGEEVIRASDRPYLGITSSELQRLSRAKSISVDLACGSRKETVVFTDQDFDNLRKLLAYGGNWKPAVPVIESSGPIVYAANVSSLNPDQLTKFKDDVKAAILKRGRQKENSYAILAYTDRVTKIPLRDTLGDVASVQLKDMADASEFLRQLTTKKLPPAETLDISAVVDSALWHGVKKVIIYIGGPIRIDDEDKAISLLHENTARLYFVWLGSDDTEESHAALSKLRHLAAASDGTVIQPDRDETGKPSK
jgi:hypothetical protein